MARIRIKGYTRKDGVTVRAHLTEDKGAPGKYEGEKWYKPKRDLNDWSKEMPKEERIRVAVASRPRTMNRHNRILSASRALQSLSNVTQDSETRIKSRSDATALRRQL